MRSLKSAVLLWTCLAGMSCAMRAQGLPGYTLQETVLVPVTGASVSSSTTLVQGVSYRLRAVGTSQLEVTAIPPFRYNQGDAEYAFQTSGFPFGQPANNCLFPSVDIGLAVNNTTNGALKSPQW